MKTYSFTQLKKETAKQKAIYEYACKVNCMLSEYQIICELAGKPYTYNFNCNGEMITRQLKTT